MRDNPLVSLVILNWNRMDETIRCLENCFHQTYNNVEIVLVDNHSEDGSREFFDSYKFELKYIKLDKNYGCPGGRNRSIHYCSGDFVFFVDNDGILDRRAVEIAMKIISSDDTISVVNGKVIDFLDVAEVNYEFPITQVKYRESFLFNGGISLIRKSVFSDIGSFPENYMYGGEETYLAYRIIDRKLKIVSSNEVVLWHKRSELARNRKREVLFLYQNVFLNAFQLYPILVFYPFIAYYVVMYTMYSVRQKMFIDFLGLALKLPILVGSYNRNAVSYGTLFKFLKRKKHKPWITLFEH